ncbi:MAG: gamma carbonic anhydrase family protein [Bacteriovoracaceae bacterium]|nr:gamma carbonic anhydrase family protein [Bacteriovoracaceae bacterium]
MSLYKFNNLTPKVGQDCFIADSADIIGDVQLGDNVNVWFNCVLRGDIHKIVIGENTNIQDLSMLHVVENIPLIIGKNVTIGHQVTLHACTVEDSCLIGMGAIILDGAVIGKNSIVAAGSVVPPGKIYPEGSFIIGNPAKIKRELSEEEKKKYGDHYKGYVICKNEFLADGGLELLK